MLYFLTVYLGEMTLYVVAHNSREGSEVQILVLEEIVVSLKEGTGEEAANSS
jgi:hypothetical protein